MSPHPNGNGRKKRKNERERESVCVCVCACVSLCACERTCSSTVCSVMRRYTLTTFCCPIRCARSIACKGRRKMQQRFKQMHRPSVLKAQGCPCPNMRAQPPKPSAIAHMHLLHLLPLPLSQIHLMCNLDVGKGVPVTVIDDNSIGLCEVQAQTPSARRKQESKHIAAI